MTKTRLLALVTAMVLLMTIPMMVSAQKAPPHAIVGTATLDGATAAEGTVVAALVDGTEGGTATADADGGFVLLVEPGDDDSFAGKTISFTVGGKDAAETTDWVQGNAEEIDLTAGEGAAVTAATTTTATATGADGADGSPGLPGRRGIQGLQGETGPAGPTGATGAIGGSGPSGASGSDGATGATGAQGSPGATGATGATGAQGAAGAAGAAGSGGSNVLGIIALILGIVAIVGVGAVFVTGRRS